MTEIKQYSREEIEKIIEEILNEFETKTKRKFNHQKRTLLKFMIAHVLFMLNLWSYKDYGIIINEKPK